MDCFFLIKYGEISLKGGNRQSFISRLKRNIKHKVKGIPTVVYHKFGRFFLECDLEYREQIIQVLSGTFGIVSFAEARKVEKDFSKIREVVVETAKMLVSKGPHFKVDCRRIDKSFEKNSYEIVCELGGALLENFEGLKVNLTRPDWMVKVEIREKAYIYGKEYPGPGGLPVGSAGNGMLLLSGGIDSPVAGYLLGKRGMGIDAIYFHTHPYTSDKVKEKVEHLGEILSNYFIYFKLYVVNFTPIQEIIKEKAKAKEVTLHSRAAMMSIADRVARANKCLCLITGESLSQVASQTVQSLSYTESSVGLPVFRPLIGLDKEDIILVARKIGTFETSILPHADCCTIFAPKHPLIKPELGPMQEAFSHLQLEEMINKAAEEVQPRVFR